MSNAIGMRDASSEDSAGSTEGRLGPRATDAADRCSANSEAARPHPPDHTHTPRDESMYKQDVSVEHDFLKNAVEAKTLRCF